MKEQKLDLYILPHIRQIFEDEVRIKVIVKGRRSGATANSCYFLIEQCLKETGKRYLFVDTHVPTIQTYIDKFFLPILSQLPLSMWKYKRKRVVIDLNGNTILFKCADNVASIEGDAFDLIVVNEAGFLFKDKKLFLNTLLPMIADTSGKMIISGTPRGGKNSFYEELYNESVVKNNATQKAYRIYPFQNPFMKPADLKLMLDTMDNQSIKQEIFGDFVSLDGIPFYYNFNRSLHVRPTHYNPEYPIFLTFDFNIDQQATIVMQHDTENDEYNVIQEFTNSGGDIEMTCALIQNHYNINNIHSVYGDASGGHRTGLMKNVTYWTLIKEYLKLNPQQIKLPSKNPNILDSKMNVNWFFKKKKINIDPKCTRLIKDLESVQTDEEGKIIKSFLDLTHFSDAFRYFVYYYTADEFFKVTKNVGVRI